MLKISRRTSGFFRGGYRGCIDGTTEHCLHGFRSTFETLALKVGIPKLLYERALFHVTGDATEQADNLAEYMEPLGLVLQRGANTVDALRDGENVPPMPDELVADVLSH